MLETAECLYVYVSSFIEETNCQVLTGFAQVCQRTLLCVVDLLHFDLLCFPIIYFRKYFG